MSEMIDKKCVLIVSIFNALDEINPDWDAKEVWQNLRQKSVNEVEAIYEQVISERKNLLEK